MSDYYIKEAINFIEQNFQNDISIEDVACINRSYLGRIFRTSQDAGISHSLPNDKSGGIA